MFQGSGQISAGLSISVDGRLFGEIWSAYSPRIVLEDFGFGESAPSDLAEGIVITDVGEDVLGCQEYHSGINHIIADAGVLNDSLLMDETLLITVNVNGQGGDDMLGGAALADTLWGNAGNDALFGAAGNDLIYGGAGNDYRIGGLGADTLNGVGGDDGVSYYNSALGVDIGLARLRQ